MESNYMNLFVCISGLLYITAGVKNHIYDFEVFPVKSCPKNKTDFLKSSSKMNCSIGRRYNCAPNRDLSSLIEFCTDRRKSLFEAGNCLHLEGKGDFDHFNCSSFAYGCPFKPYYDEELFMYQACLEINVIDLCFIAEKNCSNNNNVDSEFRNYTRTSPEYRQIIITVVSVVTFISVFVVGVCLTFRKHSRKDAWKSDDADLPFIEDSEEVKKFYRILRNKQVEVHHVKGYVVGFAGSLKNDLLGYLQSIKFISFNTKDLKPTFPSLKRDAESKFEHDMTTKAKQRRLKKNTAEAERNLIEEIAMKNEDNTEVTHEQEQIKEEDHHIIQDDENDSTIPDDVLEAVKDFKNESSKTLDDHCKTLALSDFSGKIEAFPFQQMFVQNDLFYIFAVDMSQQLGETPISKKDFGDCKWKTFREYYAHWMDIMLAFSEEQEHSFIFIAVNADNLSSKTKTGYFNELWDIYEHKSGSSINESERRKRERVYKRHHLFKATSKEDMCQCIATSLERNRKWGTSLPSFWGVVENFILKKRKTLSIMRRHELFKVCNFMSEREFIDMLKYFHDVGLIVYFDKEPLRNNIIIDVNWFFCAVENMTDPKKNDLRVNEKFWKRGLLTPDRFNEIWMQKENKSEEYRSYLQSLGIMAIFKETSTNEETFYLPILNKIPFDNMSEHYRQSSILCFRFPTLPTYLFHRLVVSCIETSNWTVRTDKSGKNLYNAQAIFQCKNHDILIGFNGNVIEARVFIIDTLFIDRNVTSVVKQDIESIIRSLCERFYPESSFEIGYKCKVLAKFCDSIDSSFITEEELLANDNQECPHCLKLNTHSINADRILGQWMAIPIRSSSKDSMKDEDDGELTDEDNKLAFRIRKACKDGNYQQFQHECKRKKVQKLLKRGFLHKHDQHGNTILHLAAEGGCFKIFSDLIEGDDKTDVFESTDIGQTVLHIACKHARLDMCIELLSLYPKLLHMKTKRSWSAIHFAAWGGNTEIIDLLEEKGLDLNDTTSNGYSILHIAAKENRYDMCKHILKNHSQLLTLKTDDGLNAAHYAAKRCNEKIFQLFEKDIDIADLTYDKKTILHIACEKGNLTFFEYIFEISPHIFRNVDEEGWNALHFAAKSGNVEIARKLTMKGLKGEDTTHDGKTILHIACIHNRYDMCCYITDTFPHLINQCNDRGWNAAHYVAVEPKQNDESIKIIDHLNTCDIELFKVTEGGNTVLTMAISHKNKKLALYLVKKHPELIRVPSKKSILDVASESNDIEIQTVIKESLQQT